MSVTCKKCGKTHARTSQMILCICGNRIRGTAKTYGIGDSIAVLTRYTGIAWLTKRLTRGSCGCDKRQAKLNRVSSSIVGWLRRVWGG